MTHRIRLRLPRKEQMTLRFQIPSRPKLHSNGFSVLELLTVLTIVGVLVTIVTPSLSKAFQQRATQGAVDQFMTAHALTRATATRFGRVAELHLDEANVRFWIEVDTSGTGIRDTVGLVHDLSEQVTMSSDRSLLCFDSRGLTTTRNACEAGDALVEFSLEGRTDTLQTTVLGKVLR